MAGVCQIMGVEKILLSSDGSEFSEGAIREGIKLAKKCSSALTVMSVIDYNPEFDTIAPQIIEKREKEARQHLDAVKARAEREGLHCTTVVRKGEDSYKYIIEEAVQNKYSLVVMGRRGRTGLKRLMVGSVTARVIGDAPCSVLVVPKAANLEFRKILVGTDGSKYSMAASCEAISLAKLNESALTVVSVVPSEYTVAMDTDLSMNQRDYITNSELQKAEANVNVVKEAALKEGVAVTVQIVSGKPPEAILQAAEQKKADLIVLGSHGRTGVERLLMGSVAERVIVLASCPVLVVKGKQ